MWLSILAIVLLLLGFFDGFRKGAINGLLSLISLLISIFLAGLLYHLPSRALFFLPGDNWENFLGFFIALTIIRIVLHFVFLLPGKVLQTLLFNGLILMILGGALKALQIAIGLVVFALLIHIYPVMEWLQHAVEDSGVLNWLVTYLSFIQAMLPTIFQVPAVTIAI
jgi:uncharacterized membrane protein required for colicin V production